MLIEIPYKDGDTVSLKTTAGEEVIGRLESETPDHITLIKPSAFMMVPQGPGLIPFMMSAPMDAKIRIPKSAIIAIVKTEISIAKQYIQQTTGLAI